MTLHSREYIKEESILVADNGHRWTLNESNGNSLNELQLM